MDKTAILALFDQDQRKNIEYPGLRREVTSDVVRHVDLAEDGEGAITFSQLSESNADAVIREQMGYFQQIGQDFEWKLYDYDTPANLKQRLEFFGFEIGEAEAIMLLDLHHAPPMLWEPIQHPIVRLTQPAKVADVIALEEQVWNEDMSMLGQFLEGALTETPDQMSVYVAYMDEQPVSAAWIYFRPDSQFASLWGGSTLKEYRKIGLYTALLAVRAQEARNRGVQYLVVDASPMSRPILEKFGFENIAYTYPCIWKQTANDQDGVSY